MKTTVIIPVFNGEKTLPACLESLAAQTDRDFRILIIDDGSTDGSGRVIREFQNAHPDMALEMIRTENRGAAEARNAGLERVDTEYTAFMDQDDRVDPGYLAAYRRAAEESGAEAVCGGYLRVAPDGGRVLRRVCPGREPWAKFVVTAPWAHLYRTAMLKDYGIRFLRTGLGEDIYFTLTAYAHARKAVTIPDTGYHWMDNPESLSNSRQRRVREEADPFLLMNRIWEDLPTDGAVTEAEKTYFLIRYGVWYLLFTLRRTEKGRWQAQYDRMTDWLKERIPDFARHRMISLFGPKGEPAGIRISVWGFAALYRLGLARPLLGALARGRS